MAGPCRVVLDAEVARLRDAVLSALGGMTLVASGCGPVTPVDDAGGGPGTPSDTGAAETSTGATTTGAEASHTGAGDSTTAVDDGDDGDDVRFDLPPMPDLAVATCEDHPYGGGRMRPSAGYDCTPDGAAGEVDYRCVDAPLVGGCESFTEECLQEHWRDQLCPDEGVVIEMWCPPDAGHEGLCCWTITIEPPSYGCPTPGRPFVVDGVARTAQSRPGSGWAEGPRPCVDGLDAITRATLERLWRRESPTRA
jgi:hypothetical protein